MKVGDLVKLARFDNNPLRGVILDVVLDDYSCYVCWTSGSRGWYDMSVVKVVAEAK